MLHWQCHSSRLIEMIISHFNLFLVLSINRHEAGKHQFEASAKKIIFSSSLLVKERIETESSAAGHLEAQNFPTNYIREQKHLKRSFLLFFFDV